MLNPRTIWVNVDANMSILPLDTPAPIVPANVTGQVRCVVDAWFCVSKLCLQYVRVFCCRMYGLQLLQPNFFMTGRTPT